MKRSETLFQESSKILVGGVNSPVRAFKSVGGSPVFFKSGKGAHVVDEDNKTYIDYVLSWGPLILGHANEEIVAAIHSAAQKGSTFGAPTEQETRAAYKLQSFMPSLEKIRFVSSGTEATMSAIRLARGYTQRDVIIKFDGCYHGHADSLLIAAGSGGLTLGQPDSAGVPDSFVQHTRILPYNDVEALEACFREEGDRIAGIILEPVCGNMGVIRASEHFAATCRHLCDQHGSVLIFDEVMTGFRVRLGGAQEALGIRPDLTCLGKVVGGGLPCAAYGGKEEIMNQLAPLGPVYQAGTLSGNPCAIAAGLATMNQLTQEVFQLAVDRVNQLVEGIRLAAKDVGIDCCIQNEGTMFTIFYTDLESVNSLEDVKACNMDRFAKMYHLLLDKGVYMAPSQYEANFMSVCHTTKDIEQTVQAFTESFKELLQDS